MAYKFFIELELTDHPDNSQETVNEDFRRAIYDMFGDHVLKLKIRSNQ